MNLPQIYGILLHSNVTFLWILLQGMSIPQWDDAKYAGTAIRQGLCNGCATAIATAIAAIAESQSCRGSDGRFLGF